MGNNKNQINENFRYTGTVIVKTIKGGNIISSTTYHNDGTAELFNFLHNCLAGKYISADKPAYIVAYYNDGANKKYSANGSLNTVSISTKAATSDESGYVEYRFVLPYLSEYSIKGIEGLLVYSTAKNPVAAQGDDIVSSDYSMDVQFSEKKLINKDETTLIVWRLEITNN